LAEKRAIPFSEGFYARLLCVKDLREFQDRQRGKVYYLGNHELPQNHPCRNLSLDPELLLCWNVLADWHLQGMHDLQLMRPLRQGRR
jgi:hypothetical protein